MNLKLGPPTASDFRLTLKALKESMRKWALFVLPEIEARRRREREFYRQVDEEIRRLESVIGINNFVRRRYR